jgi:FkbM family methyltransferase
MALSITEVEGAKFYTTIGTLEHDIVKEGYGGDYIQLCPVEEGEIWYDMGANVGGFSIYAALHGASKVYAYEPAPQTYETLVKNIELNNVGHIVTPFNVALLDEPKESVMLWWRKANTGGTSLYNPSGDGKIVARGLDVHAIDFEQDSCIKMDVEGVEDKLIPALPLHKIKKITFECHHPFFLGYGTLPWYETEQYKAIRKAIDDEFSFSARYIDYSNCTHEWAFRA